MVDGTRKGVGAYLSFSLRGTEVGWGGVGAYLSFSLRGGRWGGVGAYLRLGAY